MGKNKDYFPLAMIAFRKYMYHHCKEPLHYHHDGCPACDEILTTKQGKQRMGNITETDYFQRLQEGMETDDTFEDPPMKDSDFKFTVLTNSIEDEVLDLKNDVLKLVESVDLIRQSTVNLNHKLETLKFKMLGEKYLRLNKTTKEDTNVPNSN